MIYTHVCTGISHDNYTLFLHFFNDRRSSHVMVVALYRIWQCPKIRKPTHTEHNLYIMYSCKLITHKHFRVHIYMYVYIHVHLYTQECLWFFGKATCTMYVWHVYIHACKYNESAEKIESALTHVQVQCTWTCFSALHWLYSMCRFDWSHTHVQCTCFKLCIHKTTCGCITYIIVASWWQLCTKSTELVPVHQPMQLGVDNQTDQWNISTHSGSHTCVDTHHRIHTPG